MTLLKFYADWCQPCGPLTKVMEGMEYESIDVDTPEGEERAKKYAVSSLPTLIAVDERGWPLGRLTGLQSRQRIEELVSAAQAEEAAEAGG